MFRILWLRLWKFYDRENKTLFGTQVNQVAPTRSRSQRIGLWSGPGAFMLMSLFLQPQGMSAASLTVLALLVWIAIWWMTEPVPIPITALLPIIILPMFDVLPIKMVSSTFGDPLIFMFMGSFMIALAMERWNLHKRMALVIINIIGTNPKAIIFGFMFATGFLSMWISNTATALMMVPICIAVTQKVADSLKPLDHINTTPGEFAFGNALMIGMAYAATVGGFGTIIGAPANTILVATMNNLYGINISFAGWMLFGVPLTLLLIPLIWWYLIKVAFPITFKAIPGGKNIINEERQQLGSVSYEEKAVLVIFVLTALAWIFRSLIINPFLPAVDDTIIALTGASLLFLIPAKQTQTMLLDWKTAVKLPWGVLLLFGGGLAIAEGITQSGLALWVGERLSLMSGVSALTIIVVTISLAKILTEFTSNTATASMIYPIVAAAAVGVHMEPLLLMVAANLGATFAFMFPVASPPNAIIYASGYIQLQKMAFAGFWLNLLSIVFSIAVVLYFAPWVFAEFLN